LSSKLPSTKIFKKESADEIGRIEEVLRLYNTVVDPYNKTGITQQTKSEILSTVRKIQPSVTYIVNGLTTILGNYYRDRNSANQRKEQKSVDYMLNLLKLMFVIQ
jgi:Na+/alanine symporter